MPAVLLICRRRGNCHYDIPPWLYDLIVAFILLSIIVIIYAIIQLIRYW